MGPLGLTIDAALFDVGHVRIPIHLVSNAPRDDHGTYWFDVDWPANSVQADAEWLRERLRLNVLALIPGYFLLLDDRQVKEGLHNRVLRLPPAGSLIEGVEAVDVEVVCADDLEPSPFARFSDARWALPTDPFTYEVIGNGIHFSREPGIGSILLKFTPRFQSGAVFMEMLGRKAPGSPCNPRWVESWEPIQMLAGTPPRAEHVRLAHERFLTSRFRCVTRDDFVRAILAFRPFSLGDLVDPGSIRFDLRAQRATEGGQAGSVNAVVTVLQISVRLKPNDLDAEDRRAARDALQEQVDELGGIHSRVRIRIEES